MFVIKKDGLYLVNYQYMGIREMDMDGKYANIPTGVYSSNIRDAMAFKDGQMAIKVGGKAVKVSDE